jgi:hypothetical protein
LPTQSLLLMVGQKMEGGVEIKFPILYDDLWKTFGDPRDQAFLTNYIGLIDLSEFKDILCHVPELNAEPYFGFMGNVLMEGPVRKALRLVREEGIAYEILTWEGFIEQPRVRMVGTGLDPRCWGLAVALNDGLSDRLIRCFLRSGLEWIGEPRNELFTLAWTRAYPPGQPCYPVAYHDRA